MDGLLGKGVLLLTKIKDSIVCLYADRNDLVEREKMIQKRVELLARVKFLRRPGGIGIKAHCTKVWL